MKKNKPAYIPEQELVKGAALTAASYDKVQTIKITAAKVTVGGRAGIAEISGVAAGRNDGSIDGTMNLWLSIFRYMRPDGTINHVAGWNICIPLKRGQAPAETAQGFANRINTSRRPYKAAASGAGGGAVLTVVFAEK